MGYTHYWRRPKTIAPKTFQAIGEDLNKIILALDDAGVQLGDAHGKGVPVIDGSLIAFNGLENCGHPKNSQISIPWPASSATGIGHNQTAVSGDWFAGATLQHRACNGNCSYESLWFERTIKPESWMEPKNGLYFEFTKTAFRPYDLAVTAFLIIAKHHMGDKIKVNTDGEQPQWDDARRLCYTHLGYGVEYIITGRESELVHRKNTEARAAS